MSSNIFDDLKTIDDALKLTDELNLLKKSIYKNKGVGFVEVLQSKVSKSTCDYLTELVSGNFENSDFINTQIDKLLTDLKSIPVVTIKIGFEPTYSQITKISDHACNILNKKVLLDIYIDPQIISGAEVISNGKYYDGTSNKRFNDALYAQTKTVPREGDFLIGRLK